MKLHHHIFLIIIPFSVSLFSACDESNRSSNESLPGFLIQTTNYSQAVSSTVTADGNYLILANESMYPINSILLVKASPEGQIIWSLTIQDTIHLFSQQMIETSDNHIYLCGHGHNYGSYSRIWIAKISSGGHLEWMKYYNEYAYCNDMIVQNGTGLLLLTKRNWDEQPGFGLLKVDLFGDILINKTYDMGNNWYLHGIIPIPSGYIIASKFWGGPSRLYKTNYLLDTVVSKLIDSVTLYGMNTYSDSQFIVTGSQLVKYTPMNSDYSLKIMFVDTSLTINKIHSIPTHAQDLIRSIIITPQNEFLMAGIWQSEWPVVMKINAQGEWLWTKFLFRIGSCDNITHIRKCPNGNFLLVCDFDNYTDKKGLVVITLDADGKMYSY